MFCSNAVYLSISPTLESGGGKGEGKRTCHWYSTVHSCFRKKEKLKEVKKVFSSRLNFWRWCTQNLARSQGLVISSSHNLIVVSGFWIYISSRFLSMSEECKTGLKGSTKVTFSKARSNHPTDASTLKPPVPLLTRVHVYTHCCW